jgi:DNA-binding NarL/FixJ family response regulator
MKRIQPPGLSVASASRIVSLSQREEEVVTLVANGLTDRQIARKLKRRAVTVKRHLLQIFAKLSISSRVELIFYFYSKRQFSQGKVTASAEMREERFPPKSGRIPKPKRLAS